VRVELSLTLALIAVGGDIIQIDFEHTPGLALIGIAALMVCP
jgi:hypothetical protein